MRKTAVVWSSVVGDFTFVCLRLKFVRKCFIASTGIEKMNVPRVLLKF